MKSNKPNMMVMKYPLKSRYFIDDKTGIYELSMKSNKPNEIPMKVKT